VKYKIDIVHQIGDLEGNNTNQLVAATIETVQREQTENHNGPVFRADGPWETSPTRARDALHLHLLMAAEAVRND